MGNAKKIWNYLKTKGFNDYACAGIISNLDCESGLNPKNLQDSCQARLGMDDDMYTTLVDSGVYTEPKFVYDQAGYGLAQWTWHTRKRALYSFCKKRGASISDLYAQLDFFYHELTTCYLSVLDALSGVNSISEATLLIMLKYECPYDQSAIAQNKRISIGRKYYTEFTTNNIKGACDMGYKRYVKGQAVKISDHFYSTEFDCHGAGCCSETLVNEMLPVHLEMIRTHFNAPVTITSPYRCPIHNSRPSVGGAPGSRHTKGDACDIVVKGVAPRVVAQYCESIGILGIGLYETKNDGYFVHIDERNYKSFWYGKSERSVSTFGTYNGSVSSSMNTQNTSSLDTILSIGDKGSPVKSMQEKLIKLGYSCGGAGADGDFGGKTFEAVRKFQTDHGIGVDGIVGHQTLTAIDKAISTLSTENKSAGLTGCRIKTTASLLNVRSGAGTANRIVEQLKRGTIATVVREQDGWCELDNPAGWVSKDYIERV